MKIFEFLKRSDSSDKEAYLGPSYLPIDSEVLINDVKKKTWQAQIKTNTSNEWFRINFFGRFHSVYHNQIAKKNIKPVRLMALDNFGNEILLFDGAKYGYGPMFSFFFDKNSTENRPVDMCYLDKDGMSEFKVYVKVKYSIDYNLDLVNHLESDNTVKLISGKSETFENILRNGYDSIEVELENKDGHKTIILSEDLY